MKVDHIRKVLTLAEQAGIPAHVIRLAADELVDLIDVVEHIDPRRLEAHEKATLVARIRRSAFPLDIAALAERYGRSRATIYRWLSHAREKSSG